MSMSPSGGNDDDSIVADINMTPLIDIMLVLIIIFMVTSSTSTDSGLDINLPTTSQSTPVKEEDDKPVMVSLDKTGQTAVNGIMVPKEKLKEVIQAELEKNHTKTVIFEGDRMAMLGEAVKIIDQAKEAGATKFAVATEQDASAASRPAKTESEKSE